MAKVRNLKGALVYSGGPTGTVYAILDAEASALKIGFTTKPVNERLSTLQEGNPHPLYVSTSFKGTEYDEARLHLACKDLHIRGEWFRYEQIVLDKFSRMANRGQRG